MRIISGSARGRSLKSPAGLRIRPTSDRVREALFSILSDRVVGVGVLDLFAGTGSLGLEALSRGAGWAVFVDRKPVAVKCIKQNVELCGFGDRARVVAAPVVPYIRTMDPPAGVGLIFIDPPYFSDEGTNTLMAISKRAKSLSNCLVIYEHSPDSPPEEVPDFMEAEDSRTYGDTQLTFLRIVDEA